MKAKDIDKVADLLFRRKYTELIVSEQLILDQAINYIEQAGIREVVEALGLFENEMGFCEISNHIPYQDKLKEWGITASEQAQNPH